MIRRESDFPTEVDKAVNRNVNALFSYGPSMLDVLRIAWTLSWVVIRTAILLLIGKERLHQWRWDTMQPVGFVESFGRLIGASNLTIVIKTLNGEHVACRLFSPDPWIFSMTHEPRVTEFLTFNSPTRSFIDIGANTGRYCLLVSRNPKCKVLAVEPLQENFNLLRRNIQLNARANVVCERAAVGGSDGIAILYSRGHAAGFSLRGGDKTHSTEVMCYKLSSLLGKFDLQYVDLVMMDIEGAEFEVLRTSVEIITRIRQWIIEVHLSSERADMESFFRAFGFDVIWLDSEHLFASHRISPP